MPPARVLRIAVAAAVVLGAAAAAIVLNLALLGYAQPRNDPVGRLSPRAVLPTGTSPATPAPLPRRHDGKGASEGADD